MRRCVEISIVVLLCIAEIVADSSLVSYENMIMKEAYHFKYETSDGQMREEMGILMNPGTPAEELVVIGSYSYNSSDTMHIVMYRADRRGYAPKVLIMSKKFSSKPLDRNVLLSLVG
ncbi:endocuticle structural glycoprotein ABD-5-like [Phlebotomus argentipes]|uniref:endocuticle structural glycoprotein ABD-5-like n=1 Tax=Phlebotomus argentipes TaxID=94469 RepID=UPI0028931654|nr:endocuticle structural glycoprotein ABD-5-like [Phlebotomus argentipes]